MHQKNKIWLVLGVLFVFLAGGIWYVFCVPEKSSGSGAQQENEINSVFSSVTPDVSEAVRATHTPAPTAVPRLLTVYVCGEVNVPGVYQLPEGSRLYEAILLAGGCTEEAAEAYHNLARVLADGERIYILSKEEVEELSLQERVNGEGAQGETAGAAVPSEPETVNLNTATLEQLTSLPGIGASRAESILEYRTRVGRFQAVEEIMNISGIGEAMFAKIKDRITVE